MPVFNAFTRGPDGRPFPPGLELTGPALAVQIEVPTALSAQLQQAGQAPPAPATGLALIDTGATRTAVHEPVVQGLRVQPVNVVRIGTPAGPTSRSVYPGRLSFPGTPLPIIEFSELLGADLTGQVIPGPRGGPLLALIGRDVLSQFVLIYNGPGAVWSLAF